MGSRHVSLRVFVAIRFAVFAIMIAFAPLRAVCDTVYTNLGPNNSFNSSSDWTVSGLSSQVGFFAEAENFTPTSNFVLTQIDLPLFAFTQGSADNISLAVSANGVPGAALESWSGVQLPGLTPNTVVQLLASGSPITLSAGQQYWVVVQPAAATTWTGWFWNSTGDINGTNGVSFACTACGPGFGIPETTVQRAAFDVQGTPVSPVPEPGSFVLLCSGVLGLVGLRRLRSA